MYKIWFTIIATITLVLIWLTRSCLIYRFFCDFVKGDKESGKQLGKLIKLMIFDLLFCALTIYTIGGSGSNFNVQLIIWINAITTVFGKQLVGLITWNIKRKVN